MIQMMLPGGSLLNFNRLIRDMVTYRVLANAKLPRRKERKERNSDPSDRVIARVWADGRIGLVREMRRNRCRRNRWDDLRG